MSCGSSTRPTVVILGSCSCEVRCGGRATVLGSSQLFHTPTPASQGRRKAQGDVGEFVFLQVGQPSGKPSTCDMSIVENAGGLPHNGDSALSLTKVLGHPPQGAPAGKAHKSVESP